MGRKGAANKLTKEANCYKSDFLCLISESHETRRDRNCYRISSQLEQAIVGSQEEWRKKREDKHRKDGEEGEKWVKKSPREMQEGPGRGQDRAEKVLRVNNVAARRSHSSQGTLLGLPIFKLLLA